MTIKLTRRAVMLAGVVVCALTMPGCRESAAPSDADNSTPAVPALAMPEGEATWTYNDVLGIVAELPAADQPASAFKIHHEHIPGFVNPRTGDIAMTSEGVPGMRAMVMEMPPAQGVDISGFAAGDKVRFTFAVWNEPRVAWRLTSIETVDPETVISFDDKP